MAEPLSPATLAVTAGRPPREPDGPLNPPLVLASTYHAPGETGYGRYGNPTWSAFEQALGALEGGRAVAFSSGMAAVSAVLAGLPHGAVVAAGADLYSGTGALLRDLDGAGTLAVRPVDTTDLAAVEKALDGARLLWVESPTNPLLEESDLPALAALSRTAGAGLAVDNTFATPLLQTPLAVGATVVVHSATKALAGHADLLLGAVVCRDEEAVGRYVAHRSAHGAVPGTLETWLAVRGLRTLHLRVERAQANATELARRLAAHPGVARARYPGRGTVVSVEIAGGADAADRVVAAVRLWVHATSLGGVESSLERRRRWPAESPSVPESLVRLSVGVEDVEDLWADLAAALATAADEPGPVSR